MKHALATVGGNAVSLACVGAAIYLAVHQTDRWGWFLFVALVCCKTVSSDDATEDKEEP